VSAADIAARVRTVLGQVLGVAPERIDGGFTSETAPEWTSLNHLMLVSQLEDEFGVVFTNPEIQQLTSLDRIVTTLAARGAG
jgi:acyl carrier protein